MSGDYGGMSLPGQDPGPVWERLDEVGSRLSVVLDCSVRWPGYEKNMFVCRCGFPIAVFRLNGGAVDWEGLAEEHRKFKEEGRWQ